MVNVLNRHRFELKAFSAAILAIQLLLVGLLVLDYFGFHYSILRQLVAFVYLTFVPGSIIIALLKIDKLNVPETVLNIVGLSIASLMLIGFLINSILPYLGISNPLSLLPIVTSISIFNLFLLSILYFRGGKSFAFPSLNLAKFLKICFYAKPLPLLLITIVATSAFLGIYLENYYFDNTIIAFFLIASALSVIIIPLSKSFPKVMYPIYIYILGLCLLFHVSLISSYLIGFDIQREYYMANSMALASAWDPEIESNINGLLSVVVLPIIYARLCDIDLLWVFKLYYPLIFSLVPLGLYFIIKEQTNHIIAFYSSFYCISMPCFYFLMPQMAREEIAEVFFVLIILLMINSKINCAKRSFLLIIYSLSLIVSHYAFAYIFLGMLAFVWLLYFIIMKLRCTSLLQMANGEEEKAASSAPHNGGKKTRLFTLIVRIFNWEFFNFLVSGNCKRISTISIILIFAVFTFTWYISVTGGITFNIVTRIVQQMSDSIFTDFLNPQLSQGINIIISKTRSIHDDILKSLYLFSYLLISFGLLSLLLKGQKEFNLNKEYILMAVISFIVLIGAIVVPNFSIQLNTIRLIQIMLFFLAPFFVIGAISSLKTLYNVFKIDYPKSPKRLCSIFLSIFLSIFFIFNSGLVHELSGKTYLSSISLNPTTDNARFNDSEIACAKWIASAYDNKIIYSDEMRWVLLNSLVGTEHSRYIILDKTYINSLSEGQYLYLGILNVIEFPYIEGKSKIYNNKCNVYY